MSFECSEEFNELESLDQDFSNQACDDSEFNEPDLPIWDEDGRIHLTRTTKKGG